MNVDMNAMKAEIGGAFVLSWMVFGMGLGTLFWQLSCVDGLFRRRGLPVL